MEKAQAKRNSYNNNWLEIHGYATIHSAYREAGPIKIGWMKALDNFITFGVMDSILAIILKSEF